MATASRVPQPSSTGGQSGYPLDGDAPTADGLGRLLAGAGLFSAGTLPLTPWLSAMDGYHAALAVAHILVCAVGVAVALADRLRPCLLMASVFPYCWLVVPSIYQIAHQRAAWGDYGVTVDFAATLRGQLILLLGQAALVLVYVVVAWTHPPSGEAWVPSASGRVRLLVVAAAFAATSLVLIPLVIGAAGGVGALFGTRSDFNAALQAQGLEAGDKAARALIKTVPSGLATTAVLLALWLRRHSPKGDPIGRLAGVVAVVMLPALFLLANPFVYSRYLVLVAFGTVAVALLRPTTRRAGVVWLVAALMAFLLAYPAADTFRRTQPSASAGPILATKDYDGFQQAINTVTFVDRHGIAWGHHLASGTLFFVPRAIWSDKAQPSAFKVAEDRGYRFGNLSMPLPAEAYLDLGWPGVALVLGLVGGIFARLDRAWLEQSRLAVLAAYLAIAQVGLWRGPFGSLAPVFGFTIILIVVALALSSGRQHPGEPAQSGDSATRRH